MEELPVLKVGVIPSRLTVVSEPYVKLGFRGYMPCVNVRVEKSGLDKVLVISAKSLAEPLEKLRLSNNNFFTGIEFDLCKADDSKMALYVLKPLSK
jgi:hypothetical protein